MNATKQITTISFYRYKSLSDKLWAFGMMNRAHAYLKEIKGQRFYKLMGSGKKLGSPWADWSVYAVLQVWDNEEYARDYFRNSELQALYMSHSEQHARLYLKCLKTHGLWSGKNIFEVQPELEPDNDYIAVLTRASIKTTQLIRFWRKARQAEQPLNSSEGLLYAKGIGEIPFKNMATFSIWENAGALENYAYKSMQHREAIRDTRRLHWYSEECFSRFRITDISGEWDFTGKINLPQQQST